MTSGVELEGEALGVRDAGDARLGGELSASQASIAAAIASRTGPGRSSYSAEVETQKQPPA